MSNEDNTKDLRVAHLATGRYNPFAASAEQLLSMALDEAGLLSDETTVNGRKAEVYRLEYYRKRSEYREVTRLGSLLVRKEILRKNDLTKALALQKERGDMKIGDALLELGICSIEDIEKSLDAQIQIRKDLEDLDKFRRQTNMIKERLRTFF